MYDLVFFSNHKQAVRVNGRFGSDVFDSVFPIGSEEIETKAVLFGVDDLDKIVAERGPLLGSYGAFEDGVLHTLAEIQTFLRYAA